MSSIELQKAAARFSRQSQELAPKETVRSDSEAVKKFDLQVIARPLKSSADH